MGGEPLLNLMAFEEIVKYSKEKFNNINEKIYFDTTTNGTLFNNEIIDILNKYKVEYMVSIDSYKKDDNDFLRPSNNKNESTYSNVMINYHKYKNKSKYDSFHITVTPYNKNISKIADELYELGIYHLHFAEVISDKKDFQFNESDIEILKKEYEKLTDIVIKRITEGKETSCYPLMSNINLLNKRRHRKLKCGALNKLVAFDSVGDIYPCDMLMWDKYKIGNIQKGIDNDKLFSLKKVLFDEGKCKNCFARYLCGGECLNEKLWQNEEQKKLRCELKKHIFKLQIYMYEFIVKNIKNFNFEKYKY
nr:SPASM domain-containing protein [Clostridium botulinum]